MSQTAAHLVDHTGLKSDEGQGGAVTHIGVLSVDMRPSLRMVPCLAKGSRMRSASSTSVGSTV